MYNMAAAHVVPLKVNFALRNDGIFVNEKKKKKKRKVY